MTTANSEQFAHQAAQHATEAQEELGEYALAAGNEASAIVAQVEMQHALVCAVLALRDTIREGHA